MKLFEALILFFCFVLSSFLVSFYLLEYRDFHEGMEHLRNKNYVEAQNQFLEILSMNESHFSARLNLALIHSLQGQKAEALQEYRNVFEASKNKHFRFYSYFNSGFLKGFENKDEALDFYQKALQERKTSLEVKTNIELLMKEESQKQENQNSPEEQENQENSQDSKESSTEPSQENNSQEDHLSLEQIENIIKEIESNEQKLKMKMNQTQEEEEKGKQW